MLAKCKQAVEEAALVLGRATPTEAQYRAIEDGISAAMRRLARQDPKGWQTLSRDQQMTAGAKSVMEDIAAQAQRKLDNAHRQILKGAETEQRVQAIQEAYKDMPGHSGTRAEALKRDFELSHSDAAAERKIAFGSMADLIEAAGNTKGAGLGRWFMMKMFDVENPVMTRDIVREIFKNGDGATKNDVAQAGARAWLDTIEGLRQRFNNAGGDVGRLDYGYVPQPWDTSRIRKGRDAFAQFMLPLVDRSRYLREDGSRMSDQEVFDVLNKSVETLASNGLNKQEPGAFKGVGARANRGADSRQIHFADGDAWLTAMKQYGRGSIYDAMTRHIAGITRDITLVERYGPDAAGTARTQIDLAKEAETDPKVFSIKPQTYWDMISGKTGAPDNQTLSNTMQMVRSLQTAGKLGGAVISSVTDLHTLIQTTGFNRLPYWQLVKDIGSQGSKETRDWMTTHGMIAESAAGEINRWSGDHIGANWSGRVANSVLRLSLLNAWTDGLRQGFTMTMNAGLAKWSRMDWMALNEFDRSRLTRAGFTADDWAALNKIQPESFKGRDLLTPQTIKASGIQGADSLAAKVFGFIHDESEFAVVNPDLASRAITTWGGTQAGTAAGEIARTIMQFKSFPITMITRHWARALEGDHGADGAPLAANRFVYGMTLLLATTALGAVATQAKQVLQGKDPIDMKSGRFWAKAVAQGGGFSIVGDLFLVDPQDSSTDAATTAVKNLAGPTVGSATDLVLKNISENIWQASEGKDTHWQAELAQWARNETPGANLWWLRPAVDHLFMNSLNENMSPGYLSRMQQRAQKAWGQRYWWRPQDAAPQRPPDLGAAVK